MEPSQPGIFSLHKSVMTDYADYVRSFVHIANPEIRDAVQNELCQGNKYWPDPIIQFNPAYKPGETTENLVARQVLHADCLHTFTGFPLYQHQVSAIKLGSQGKGFIVTSGTGSGKSLTFLGTIFNHLLKTPNAPGVQAVIVYPMNALINSQYQEIVGYSNNYKTSTGKDFPITFEQYTGQEDSDLKARIRANPPQILLTNYMMLELLLTRHQELELRQGIYENLRFLVYDELHTFRGRQGSDVAILNRRIQSSCRHTVTCIGTSATMVSTGSPEEQRSTVARVASRFFGAHFEPDQVVQEILVQSFQPVSQIPEPEAIRSAIALGVPQNSSDDAALCTHPLALWIENAVALEFANQQLKRRKPIDLPTMVERLTAYIGGNPTENHDHLQSMLFWINHINSQKSDNKKSYLPFKLHQFISQTGYVYATLGFTNRVISLEPELQTTVGEEVRNLYPLVFSRSTGGEFFCVSLDENQKRIVVRHQDEVAQSSSQIAGYIMPGQSWWNPEEDFENLPDSWFKGKGENRIPKEQTVEKLPQAIWFDDNGVYSFSNRPDLKNQGWFIKYPLAIDPSSGEVFTKHTREGNKLGRIGSEGRSTSTTVLSLSILQAQANAGVPQQAQKLMSFTDNRQDAALQAGHFNDFYQVVRLRSALYTALKNQQRLEYHQVSSAVVEQLGLRQEQFSRNPGSFPKAIQDNEQALNHYVMYRLLEDLERSWRVTLPNLEQCALLQLKYKNLQENAEWDQGWKQVPLVSLMNVSERIEFLSEVLQYIRKGFAISSKDYLDKNSREEKDKVMRERLRVGWHFPDLDDLPQSKILRIETLGRGYGEHALAGGHTSMLGRYINGWSMRITGSKIKRDDYPTIVHTILDTMSEAGMLTRNTRIKKADGGQTTVYQIPIDTLVWTLGDGVQLPIDLIRNKATKVIPQKVNVYFKSLYESDFQKYTKKIECPNANGENQIVIRDFYGAEHTGQLNNEDRQTREREFRAGALSALFCSPTMELGIDISSVNVVHMRNVPPNAANYAQRSGRAGRSGQAALVVVNCSNFSPHDRHYFRNKQDMVAGLVTEPRIDLLNEELLKSHLHSMALGMASVSEIQNSLYEMVFDENGDAMPLKPAIAEKLNLSLSQQNELKVKFKRTCEDFWLNLHEQWWFTKEWLDRAVTNVVHELDNSMNRFRTMYRHANHEIHEATAKINLGNYKQDSDEWKDAKRQLFQGERQRSNLKNDSHAGTFSEFYPYRYLASEGFLPGYNFTRLPIRAFITDGDGGEFISRPRAIALREFGPRNIIYHNGSKHTIRKLSQAHLEKSYHKARISLDSGYFLEGDWYNSEVCPFTNAILSTEGNCENINDLVEMTESETRPELRIGCEEEERISQGYDIQTYFSVPDGMQKVRRTHILQSGEDLLHLSYIPAAKLIHVNHKWKSHQEEGFLIGERSGFWKNKRSNDEIKDPNAETVRAIKLYTYDWADALFIEPVRALDLNRDGVITLMYALKRAIEQNFQIEGNEIGACIMGKDNSPNIFLYESSQGSLGILSQFYRDVDAFHKVINKAIELCNFNNPENKTSASYNDLLSYYNQRDHQRINRFLIQEALQTLLTATVELKGSSQEDYEDQYQRLLKTMDHNSSTEMKFLDYLYSQGLRLPDSAQKTVEGMYCQPDFYYQEANCWIFCDGTPHDDLELRKRDNQQREALRARGDQVWVYYYKENLAQIVAIRPDIFNKVKQ
jgi:superfamily II DNA/RNA helicase